MRLENLGLPGSGKSTLSSQCRKQLAASGHVSVDSSGLSKIDQTTAPSNARLWHDSRWRQTYHLARFLDQHAPLHQVFNQLYDQNFRNLSLVLDVGADLSRYDLLSDQLHSFWVDEGFFHLGCHALLDAAQWAFPDCLTHLDALIDAVPLPNAILHTDATVDVATKGIFARLEGRSPEHAQRRFNKAFGGAQGMDARARLIDAMVLRLEGAGAKIITLKAHGDLDLMCDSVLDHLNEVS